MSHRIVVAVEMPESRPCRTCGPANPGCPVCHGAGEIAITREQAIEQVSDALGGADRVRFYPQTGEGAPR